MRPTVILVVGLLLQGCASWRKAKEVTAEVKQDKRNANAVQIMRDNVELRQLNQNLKTEVKNQRNKMRAIQGKQDPQCRQELSQCRDELDGFKAEKRGS